MTDNAYIAVGSKWKVAYCFRLVDLHLTLVHSNVWVKVTITLNVNIFQMVTDTDSATIAVNNKDEHWLSIRVFKFDLLLFEMSTW